jgi:hypothetical protein
MLRLGELTREELLKAKPGVINTVRMPNKQTLKLYNLTPSQYIDLLRKQNFVCAICERVQSLVIDHDHKTNAVRGLLCNRCNWGMGFIDAGLGLKGLQYKKNHGKFL